MANFFSDNKDLQFHLGHPPVSYTHLDVYKRQVEMFAVHVEHAVVFSQLGDHRVPRNVGEVIISFDAAGIRSPGLLVVVRREVSVVLRQDVRHLARAGGFIGA